MAFGIVRSATYACGIYSVCMHVHLHIWAVADIIQVDFYMCLSYFISIQDDQGFSFENIAATTTAIGVTGPKCYILRKIGKSFQSDHLNIALTGLFLAVHHSHHRSANPAMNEIRRDIDWPGWPTTIPTPTLTLLCARNKIVCLLLLFYHQQEHLEKSDIEMESFKCDMSWWQFFSCLLLFRVAYCHLW